MPANKYDPVCHCGVQLSKHSVYDGHPFTEMETRESMDSELATLRAQLSALSAGMSRIRTVLASYDANDAVGHIHEVAESFATPNLAALAAEWERGRKAQRDMQQLLIIIRAFEAATDMRLGPLDNALVSEMEANRDERKAGRA